MSKFSISLKNEPTVSIKMTEDLYETNKKWISEIFGVKAIQGMFRDHGIVSFIIEADKDEIEIMTVLLKKIYDAHIVKDIDIDLNMN
jgi:uncharacterized protein YqgQ